MSNPTLNIDGGELRLTLRNAATDKSVDVLLAVYDVFFIGRILECADKCDEANTALSAKSPSADAGNNAFIDFYHKAQEADREIRGVIDELFDAPVCDTLFPNYSMFAIGNGAPVWANLLTAIVEQMDSGLDAEKKKAQERIKKYSAKYKK